MHHCAEAGKPDGDSQAQTPAAGDVDGAPTLTRRAAVVPGSTFVYDFVAEPAGTFFFHSHFGLQLKHGLYAPLIIEAAREPLTYDREYVLVFDDWPARSPEAMLADLKAGRGPMNMADLTAMTVPMPGMAVGVANAATAPAAQPGMAAAPAPALRAVHAAEPGDASPAVSDVCHFGEILQRVCGILRNSLREMNASEHATARTVRSRLGTAPNALRPLTPLVRDGRARRRRRSV